MGYFQDFIDMSSGILDSVNHAVDSNDYSRLNKDIQARVAGFSSEAAREREMRKYTEGLNFGQAAQRERPAPKGPARPYTGPGGAHTRAGTGSTASGRRGARPAGQSARASRNPYSSTYSMASAHPVRGNRKLTRTPFLQHMPSRASSVLKIVFGLIGSIPTGILALASLIVLLGTLDLTPFLGVFVGCGIPAVLFGLLARSGFQGRKLLKRFYRYAQALGKAEFIPISVLADRAGDTPDDTRKYLKEMKQKQYLPQARFDDRETTLILTDHAYQQYQTAKRQSEQARADAEAAARKAEAENGDSGISSEIREILREGDAYIREVHHCNDLIPGQEMSDKLDRLENVVTRIFEQVREHPERAGELHKFMNYYLPMTEKLLHAYIDLDKQPAAGENIETTRKEIEDVIDTINEAFETILDDMFEDVAWDISSDISAMKTMMRQDGLTDDELHRQRAASGTADAGDSAAQPGPELTFGEKKENK